MSDKFTVGFALGCQEAYREGEREFQNIYKDATFTLATSGKKIILDWNLVGNPHVIIRRGTTYYPSDDSDGVLIYDGNGNSCVDENNILPNTEYCYRLFCNYIY